MIYLIRLIHTGLIILGSFAIGFYICGFELIYPSSYQLARNQGLERYQTQLENLLSIHQGHYQSLPNSDPLYPILQQLPFENQRKASIEQLKQLILQSNPRAMFWAAQLIRTDVWTQRSVNDSRLFGFNKPTLLEMAAANKDPYAARDLARDNQCRDDQKCHHFWLSYAMKLFAEKAEQGDYRARYELEQLKASHDYHDAAQLDKQMSFAIDAAKHQFYYPLATLLLSYQRGDYLPLWVDTGYRSNQAYLNTTDKKLLSKLAQWLTDRQYIVDGSLIKIARQELNQDDYHRLFIQYTLLGKIRKYRTVSIRDYYLQRIQGADKAHKKHWAIEAMALFSAMENAQPKNGEQFNEQTQYFYNRRIKSAGIQFDKADLIKIAKLTDHFKQRRSHNIYLTPNNTYIPDL